MQNSNPQTLFSEADQLLLAADREMNRSGEDVVTHLICSSSRQSIANYLMGYLIEKEVRFLYPISLNELLEKCKEIDPRFGQLDFTPIQCRFGMHDKDYCLDIEKVGECFRIAEQTQKLVRG